ncbi:hypothetical protein psyc5s11_53680 [Clostridium gelidum]|uniref:Uncharacterized protein n=1 Tax=Clostridium gelidum TaxID=704125 RepID=A0ABM7TN79_9CLOT|nr:hypothetical protein [Clostridium gelidum]BCZ49301.1 hypothetical protein psyc5s11_53680 [Clostridium gelidum]
MITENREVLTDNVVGRLYHIIYQLKSDVSENAEKVFLKVFSLDENNKIGIFTNYTELLKMCTLGISQIEQLQSKNLHKYQLTLNQTMNGLTKINFNTSSGMRDFSNHFDEKLMISLEYCADFLSEHSNEEDIEDEKIQELIEEINVLIEEVLVCNFNDELKKILIYQLNNVRESLFKYKLYGAEGVVNNISTALGTLILNREKANDEESKITIKKIFEIIGKINTVMSFKNNSENLLSYLCKKIVDRE